MGNGSGNDEPPKRSGSKLSLLSFKPVFSIPTERAGPLDFYAVSMGGMSKLEKLASGKRPEPSEFLDHLILVTGQHPPANDGDKGKPVSEEDIELLSPEERASIAKGLLDGLNFQSEPVMKTEDGPDGERIRKIDGYEVVTPREEGESDEAYLQRAWDEHNARFTARWRKATAGISEQLAGFSSGLREAIGPGLLANYRDSQKLSEQLSGMLSPTRRIADELKHIKPFGEQLRDFGISSVKPPSSITDHLAIPRDTFEPAKITAPYIPPNPIHETNSLLSAMGDRIEGMYEVSRSTAAMQQSLNDVARDAVALFASGAEASKQASEQSLRVSGRALLVAVVSAVLTAAAVGVTVWSVLGQGQGAREAAELQEARYREDRALRLRELATTERLADELQLARERPLADPGKRKAATTEGGGRVR